ncbi:hypothetical protein L226DRAFT_559242 [Lentinus tigrinus ALCF2SS1-7]|uniref:uncharacterized protein n=1 Tax=Lentinus tigrinus ALCF2SS1-7 TaxID=1328758 RepID=UPI0011660A72|nr:hypothetical protein L226DRAFT_559242 [Lentinus tigrinus ALCF2SS1-7]
MAASFKRARSPAAHDISPSSSPPSSPTLKALRTSATPPPHSDADPSPSSAGPSYLLCTLPPTCHPPNRPTELSGTRELEQHYAMYHAHVCEENGCGCVFPDARLLELHQTECHDPIAAVRQERGDKIFACFLATCPGVFSTPARRRQHLIQAHGYPKEYFFAVTNKGVGGLLKKWGEGASMLRRPWRARDSENQEDQDTAVAEEDVAHKAHDKAPTDSEHPHDGHSDSSEDEILLEKIQVERPVRARESESAAPAHGASHDVDTLANALDSLALVPSTIQFGRGAKRGARGHQPRRVVPPRGGDTAQMDVDSHSHPHPHPPPRGRGSARGGHGMPPMPPRGAAMRGVVRGRGRGGGPWRGELITKRGVGRGAN